MRARSGSRSAEQASRRALEAAPQLAEAHVARGLARSLSRHYDEAVERVRGSDSHQSLSVRCLLLLRQDCVRARRHGARGRNVRRSRRSCAPRTFKVRCCSATAARALGREDAAHEAVRTGIRRAEQVLALNPHDGRALSLGAGALIDDGQTERALEWSRQCLELYPDDTSALVNIACVHAQGRAEGRGAGSARPRVRARLRQARLDRERSGLRQPAQRAALPATAQPAQVSAVPTVVSTPSH